MTVTSRYMLTSKRLTFSSLGDPEVNVFDGANQEFQSFGGSVTERSGLRFGNRSTSRSAVVKIGLCFIRKP